MAIRFALLVLYKRKSLFDKIVALAELVDCVVDQIARHLVEAVREIMQLLGMVSVVVEHVLQKSECFFR